MATYDTPFQVIDMMKEEWDKFGKQKISALAKRNDPQLKHKELLYRSFTQSMFKKLELCAKEHVFTKTHVVEPLDQELATSVYKLNKEVQILQAKVLRMSQTVPPLLESSMQESWKDFDSKLRKIDSQPCLQTEVQRVDLSGLKQIEEILKDAADQTDEAKQQVDDVLLRSADTVSNVSKVLNASHTTETDQTIQNCYTSKAGKAAAEAVVVQKTMGILNRKRGIDCIENVQLQSLLPQPQVDPSSVASSCSKRVKTFT